MPDGEFVADCLSIGSAKLISSTFLLGMKATKSAHQSSFLRASIAPARQQPGRKEFQEASLAEPQLRQTAFDPVGHLAWGTCLGLAASIYGLAWSGSLFVGLIRNGSDPIYTVLAACGPITLTIAMAYSLAGFLVFQAADSAPRK